MATESAVAEINETRLAYEVAGKGPPVAFVHGFTLDRRMWDDQIPAFATRYRTVRYDLRGFGESASPRAGEPYTHADDLRALLTHLDIERAAVIGLSLGGWVAHEFALTYPESVSALILVGSAMRGYPYGPTSTATIDSIYRLGAEGRIAEAKAGWLADPLFACSARSSVATARLQQIVDDYPCWHLLNSDPHPPLEPPAIERLPQITAPTLVMVGEEDTPDMQAISDLLAARIPGARKVVLAKAGHMANMDAPDAFNHAALGFLASLGETLNSLSGDETPDSVAT